MTIRWGIVSAAKICNDFVNAVNSYPDKGDQVIAAVAARDKGRAEAFAKLHSIKTVFDSYQAMAESKDVIDVAYIGALNPDHYALAKLFLENGKHVLCEKPLTLNLKQTQSLIKIAKQKKLFLMEAVWSRFWPSYVAMEKEINSGVLGDIKLVEANFGIPVTDVARLGKKDMGGSAMLDLGIYVVQFALFVFKDEPSKVTAVGYLNDDGVDIIDHVVLEYPGRRRAVLNVDGTTKLWNKGTVTGTKGRITVSTGYTLQFAQFVFKHESSKVTAVGYLNDDGVDIIDHVVLEYSGRRRAVLNVDGTTKLWNKGTVTGTKGRITLEDPFHCPDKLVHSDGTVETFSLHSSKLPYNFGNSAGLVYESLEVTRCIREGLLESPRMSHRETLILAKIMDTVRQQVGVHYDADDKEYP